MSYHAPDPQTYPVGEKDDVQPYSASPSDISPLPPPERAKTHDFGPPPLPFHCPTPQVPLVFSQKQATLRVRRGLLNKATRMLRSLGARPLMAACAAIILSGVPLVAVILTLIGCALADSAGIYKGLPVGRFCLAAIAMGLILGIILTVLACIYIQFLLGTKRLPWLRKRVPGVVGWGVACACVFALPAGLHAFRWFAAYRGHTGLLIIAAALGLVASAAPLCGLAYAVVMGRRTRSAERGVRGSM